MKTKLAILTVYLCVATAPALGQSVQAVVGVGANNTTLCQQTPPPTATAPVTSSCPTVTWNDGGGNSGSGSGTATATYGFLQSFATAQAVATTSSGSVGVSAATTTGTSFTDYLTFPNLGMNATLKATLSVSGAASGNLLASSISADINLRGNTFGQCSISASTGGPCTTSIPIAPGDRVQIDGSLNSNASTNVAPNSAGSDSATLNFNSKKSFGAQFAFVVVDSSGKPIGGAKIVAASGTKYATR